MHSVTVVSRSLSYMIQSLQLVCVIGLCFTVLIRGQLCRNPEWDKVMEVFEHPVKYSEACTVIIWVLHALACIVSISHMQKFIKNDREVDQSLLIGVLANGTLFYNLYVAVTAYYNWTIHFKPAFRALQIFPTANFLAHSYIQVHYLMSYATNRNHGSFFTVCFGLLFNMVMLVHFSSFRDLYISSPSLDVTSLLTLIKAVLAMFEITHRLIALYKFSEMFRGMKGTVKIDTVTQVVDEEVRNTTLNVVRPHRGTSEVATESGNDRAEHQLVCQTMRYPMPQPQGRGMQEYLSQNATTQPTLFTEYSRIVTGTFSMYGNHFNAESQSLVVQDYRLPRAHLMNDKLVSGPLLHKHPVAVPAVVIPYVSIRLQYNYYAQHYNRAELVVY